MRLMHGIQQYELDPNALSGVPVVEVHQQEALWHIVALCVASDLEKLSCPAHDFECQAFRPARSFSHHRLVPTLKL